MANWWIFVSYKIKSLIEQPHVTTQCLVLGISYIAVFPESIILQKSYS